MFSRRFRLVLLLVCLLATACPGSPTTTPTAQRPIGNHPNIVFILTDDLSTDLMAVLPKTNQLITSQGMSFKNYFLTDSLCCPSRSSIFRGQYPHNTQIFTNGGNDGGHAKFHSTGDDTSTVATWLQAGGYRTALMGKYLNGYLTNQAGVPNTFVPPGWSEWDVAGSGYAEFNYKLNENGTIKSYGNAARDYLVDVMAAKGNDYIKKSTEDGKPFFLELAPFVPHVPSVPAPRYADTFPDAKLPQPPSFNEPDTSDKASWLRALPPLSNDDIKSMEVSYRKREQCLQAVDDMVSGLVTTLKNNGQLNNTYFVFSSDNGYHMGEHRLQPGKQTAFDTDIRVPLLIRGPGVPAGSTSYAIAMNVDLAPTFAAWAGVTPPSFVDGRSLTPVLTGAGKAPSGWRTAALVEHHGPDTMVTDPDLENNTVTPITYEAVATQTLTYVEYIDGEFEFYDRSTDPYQLTNTYATGDQVAIKRLAAQLAALKTCKADACRTADSM